MSRLESLARNAATGTNYRGVTIANPGAHLGFTIAPDTGRAWQVLAVTALLTTSSDAGQRFPELSLSDGANTFWTISSGTGPIESTVTRISWLADYSYSTNGVQTEPGSTPMPPAIVLPGWSLVVALVGGQTTDQFTLCRALVLETSTGEREYARTLAGNLGARAEAIADLLTGDV